MSTAPTPILCPKCGLEPYVYIPSTHCPTCFHQLIDMNTQTPPTHSDLLIICDYCGECRGNHQADTLRCPDMIDGHRIGWSQTQFDPVPDLRGELKQPQSSEKHPLVNEIDREMEKASTAAYARYDRNEQLKLMCRAALTGLCANPSYADNTFISIAELAMEQAKAMILVYNKEKEND